MTSLSKWAYIQRYSHKCCNVFLSNKTFFSNLNKGKLKLLQNTFKQGPFSHVPIGTSFHYKCWVVSVLVCLQNIHFVIQLHDYGPPSFKCVTCVNFMLDFSGLCFKAVSMQTDAEMEQDWICYLKAGCVKRLTTKFKHHRIFQIKHTISTAFYVQTHATVLHLVCCTADV